MTGMTRRTWAPIALAISLLALLAAWVPSTIPEVGAAAAPVVSVGDQSGLERDETTGSVFVPVTLSEPAGEPIVVSFHTADGSAIAGEDYVRWGTPSAPRSVTIPAGALQGTVNVQLLADGASEADETFSVVLSGVAGGGATIGRATGTATIVDSDPLFGPNPAITVSNPSVVEGDVGQRRVQFQVHLSRAPATNVTVSYVTVAGSAIAGEDFTDKLPGTVVFAPGQISKTIDVLVSADAVAGAERTFQLEVSVSGGSPVEELTMSGTATILDDDGVAQAGMATQVSVGALSACAVRPDGKVSCWGENSTGQLGDGTRTTRTTPVAVSGLQQVTAVSSGGPAGSSGTNTTCATRSDDTAWCWGSNATGAAGAGDDTYWVLTPNQVALDDVAQVSVGNIHSCARTGDGGAWCWGWNAGGRLGNGDPENSTEYSPVPVSGLADVVDIAAGTYHSCAVRSDGTVWCWGGNGSGMLGNGTQEESLVPAQVIGVADAVSVSTGTSHTCAVRESGAVTCWGMDADGQLGDGPEGFFSPVPVDVLGLDGVVSVTLGESGTCAVLETGRLSCWGRNNGAFGLGTTPTNLHSPQEVPGLSQVTSASLEGQYHFSTSTGPILGERNVLCVVDDGRAKCVGSNEFGQLGNSTTVDSQEFVDVALQ